MTVGSLCTLVATTANWRLLVFVTCLWGVTSAMDSELVSCDGDGLIVMIHGIDGSRFRGSPYVYGDCLDPICGQDGDAWTKTEIFSNRTWTLHLTMHQLQGYPSCSTMIRNATDYYYTTRIVLPRSSEHIELAGDYVIDVRCHIHDIVTVKPDVNTVFVESNITSWETLTDTVNAPSVVASIVRAANDQIPVGRVSLGERLKLQVRFLDDLGEFWNQIRVITFEAYDRTHTEHYRIVTNGCPTEQGRFINAFNTEDFEPVTEVEFDAFRFKEQEDVYFALTVSVCKGQSSDFCDFSCNSRGKRSADLKLGYHDDHSVGRSERNAQNLLAAMPDHVEMRTTTPLQTTVVLPEKELPTWEEDFDDIVRLPKELPDGEYHTKEIVLTSSSSSSTDICLDFVQLSVVCALLILVLLIAACATGYHSYKMIQHRFISRPDYGQLSMLARRGSVPADRLLCQCRCQCKRQPNGQRSPNCFCQCKPLPSGQRCLGCDC